MFSLNAISWESLSFLGPMRVTMSIPAIHLASMWHKCPFVSPAQEEGFPCILPLIRYCCSVPKLGLTLCDPMDCSTPGLPSFTVSWSLPKFVSTESMILTNHLILCCPLLLLPSIFPSIRVLSNEGLFSFCMLANIDRYLPGHWVSPWYFSLSTSLPPTVSRRHYFCCG